VTVADSDGDDDGNLLNIHRFAYKSDTRKFKASQPVLISTRSASTSNFGITPPKKTTMNHRFSQHFSDAELANLAKCISCDIRWTSRKSVSQKMVHVQSCARKNSLTDETVRILIRKELDIVPAHNLKAKGKEKVQATPEPSEPGPQNTYLEDIINNAVPKKKGKRPEVLKTVKSVTETRNVILDRARSLLSPVDDVQSVPTGYGVPQGPNNTTVPPSTQSFGQSALAQESDFPASHLRAVTFNNSQDPEADIDPPTQQFAPSKLAVAFRHPSPTSGSGPDMDVIFRSPPPSNSSLTSRALPESPATVR
jgi:hypothetical protein